MLITYKFLVSILFTIVYELHCSDRHTDRRIYIVYILKSNPKTGRGELPLETFKPLLRNPWMALAMDEINYQMLFNPIKNHQLS